MDNLRTRDTGRTEHDAPASDARMRSDRPGSRRSRPGAALAVRLSSVVAIALALGACFGKRQATHVPGPVVGAQPGPGIALEDSTLEDALRVLAAAGARAAEAAAADAAEAESREMLIEAVSRCRPSLPDAQRRRIADAIHAEATRHGYDPLFVMAIVEVESTCSPTANGKRGAVGLIQIKPSTAREVAKGLGVRWQGRSTLTQPLLNVRLGLTYLRQLEERFGDLHVAMAAYNMGPERVRRMSQGRAKGARYVKKILARYEGLRGEHAA